MNLDLIERQKRFRRALAVHEIPSPDALACAALGTATNVCILPVPVSIRNSNQFQIVRPKDFPFRVVYLHSKGFSGAFVQNLKTFLAAGEEITLSPLTQSNDDREQLPAFGG